MKENKNSLNILIVDDEIEACDNLKNMLHAYIDPAINIAGMAYDTAEAERLIKKHNPDAVFLDIEMPEENAFQFLNRVSPIKFEIIFVTAYDEFAIKAFKLNAVDYILKPICIDELSTSIVKLKERLDYKTIAKYNEQQVSVLKQISNREHQYKITLKSLNHIELVDFKDLYSIEGQGSYCKICFNKKGIYKEIITSNTIAHYEDLLPPDLFFRIHKSYLLNCMHIIEILSGDKYEVVIKNKITMPVSRRRYSSFIQFLKENNFYKSE